MVQQCLQELVGRSDSDWAGDPATRQSVTGHHMSEADSNQSQFMRSRVLRSQCLRRRIVGTRRTLQGTSQRFSSSRDGFRLGKTHSAAQRSRWTQTHRDTMLVNTAVDTRKNVYRWGEWTQKTILQISSRNTWIGWTENDVARKETWTANPGRHD